MAREGTSTDWLNLPEAFFDIVDCREVADEGRASFILLRLSHQAGYFLNRLSKLRRMSSAGLEVPPASDLFGRKRSQ